MLIKTDQDNVLYLSTFLSARKVFNVGPLVIVGDNVVSEGNPECRVCVET